MWLKISSRHSTKTYLNSEFNKLKKRYSRYYLHNNKNYQRKSIPEDNCKNLQKLKAKQSVLPY